MNNFYLARKTVRWAAFLNIFSFCFWAIMIFLVFIYHFLILLGNGSDYAQLKQGNGHSSSSSSTGQSVTYIFTYIAENGYSGFFKHPIISFWIFNIPFWYLIFPLFLASVGFMIAKVGFGIFSLLSFIKSKNIFLVFASVSVIFLPLFGGLIALNIYKSTSNDISPEFVTPYSLLRRKLAIFLNSLNGNDRKLNNSYINE